MIHATDAPKIIRPGSGNALRDAAQQMEAQFLAMMLKSSGFGQAGAEPDGGVGEEQFRSFLIDEHAKAMTRAGGVGLAESIYEALRTRT